MSYETPDVSALDLESMAVEERIEYALDALVTLGVKPNGLPVYSIREASALFLVPNSTLHRRWNGGKSRQVAHEEQMKLRPGEEAALVSWIIEMGRRGIPMRNNAVALYAQKISGSEVGDIWVRRFRMRHPELKGKFTTGLEKCRAQALNPAAVKSFFSILEEVVEEYEIPLENIYNMDEKGIQLGVGTRVYALIDRNQETAYQVEDGNREMVTVIEAVCADGTAIPPSFVFKGVRRDLEWGRVNPCNASISHSPKGWTDQELGYKWLTRDFEPATAKRNKSGRHRLLILDGHNSHTTYKLCNFAAKHNIIILCLPPHTTHRLQPCDVGVFGPLAGTWKKEVNLASAEYIEIRKHNLIRIYSKARSTAFAPETIRNAFRTTGIWPFNPSAIEVDAFAPALNTTTQSAQLVPAILPPLLALVPPTIPTSSFEDVQSLPPISELTAQLENLEHNDPESPPKSRTPSSTSLLGQSYNLDTGQTGNDSTASAMSSDIVCQPQFVLVGVPQELPFISSHAAFKAQNTELRELLRRAQRQMEMDYALKKLMDQENGCLRPRLFDKSNKQKKKETTGFARHMTNDENLDALAMEDWKMKMKEVWKEGAFKARREAYDNYEKALAAADKASEREAERSRKEADRLQKEAEKHAEKHRKAEEKAIEKRAKDAEKARLQEEKDRTKALKEAEKQRVAAAKAAKQTQAAVARALKTAAAAKKPVGTRTRRQAAVTVEAEPSNAEGGTDELNMDAADHGETLNIAPRKPRPRPRPTGRMTTRNSDK